METARFVPGTVPHTFAYSVFTLAYTSRLSECVQVMASHDSCPWAGFLAALDHHVLICKMGNNNMEGGDGEDEMLHLPLGLDTAGTPDRAAIRMTSLHRVPNRSGSSSPVLTGHCCNLVPWAAMGSFPQQPSHFLQSFSYSFLLLILPWAQTSSSTFLGSSCPHSNQPCRQLLPPELHFHHLLSSRAPKKASIACITE